MDLVLKYHPHNNISTVLLYGSLPGDAYQRLMKYSIDLVVLNSAEPSPLSFTIPIPGDILENFVRRKVGIMVFYVENTEALAEALMNVTLTIHWASGAKMLIFTSEKQRMDFIFYLFWWYKSIDCIILVKDENTGQISMYRYFPYVEKQLENQNQYGCWSDKQVDEMYEDNILSFLHCNQSCDMLDMNSWSTDMFIQTCIEIEIISNDIDKSTLPSVRNLKGYPLKMHALNKPLVFEIDTEKKDLARFSGTDANLLKALTDKMNFTVKHITIDNVNEKMDYQNYVFSFHDLANRKYDISLYNSFVVQISFPVFGMLYPVEQSGRCFLVHRAGQVPVWYNLFTVFDVTSFGLLVLVFHIVVLNFYVFIRFSRKSSIFQAIILAYIYTIQLFLLSPVNWVSKHNYIRFLIFMVFWFVFVLNFMFQGLIISSFTVPRYGAEINTLVDLDRSGVSLEGVPSADIVYDDMFRNPKDPMLAKLNKKFVKNFDALACPKDLIKSNKKGCWLDCLMADFVQKTYRDNNGNLPIHIGKDKYHSFFTTYLIWNDSPLIDVLNLHIRALKEGGILKHWRELFMGTSVESKLPSDVKVLTLRDLQGCFYMLLVGNILAFFVFLLELLSNNIIAKSK